MKRRVGYLALILSFAGMQTRAADVFDHPVTAKEPVETTLAAQAKEIRESTVLTGQFTQQRVLPGIPKPLTSSGDFLLAHGLGLYWHMAEPYEAEFTLTPSGMILRDGTSQARRITARDRPGMRVAMEIFSAMFALDLTRLERHFELFATSQDGQWQLGLRPRQKRMAAMFREAVITGSLHAERVELLAGDGGRTTIELSAVTARTTGLTAQERQRFQ